MHARLRGELATHEAGKRESYSANILAVSVSTITPPGGPDMMQRNQRTQADINNKVLLSA